jgi:crotonobetainyl-CoA:carnitine CoA-transferase CaiB-like acyl-CoA transferase
MSMLCRANGSKYAGLAARALAPSNHMSTSSARLPYEGIRVLEKSKLLTGRLAGLLFADQGAEVLVCDDHLQEGGDTDDYLNRNKLSVCGDAVPAPTVDIVIVDGDDDSVERLPHQILLRTVAALPGDAVYGHLPYDVDEDYLSALTGFFTDMDMMGWLDRPVTYTPLKLCSIYAGVIGANAVAAALVDRLRCGEGREIHASRLAGGLSAIGALCLKQKGLPEHLNPAPAIYKDVKDIPPKRKGLPLEELERYKAEAIANPRRQEWLFQRLYPFMAPYRCQDGKFILPMATFNRRLAVGYCKYLGFLGEVEAFGIVDKDPYDPASMAFDDRNLALPMGFNWPSSSKCAELFEAKFLEKPAGVWEAELEAAGLPCAEIQSWQDWMKDPHARAARVVADVEGLPDAQLGRTAWLKSVGEYPNLKKMEAVGATVPDKKEPPTAGGGGSSNNSNNSSSSPAARPLEGFVIADFANVIAGPACGRMLAELGATVYKLGPGTPQHGPMVMMVWQAELHQGKQSIIIDGKKAEGKAIIQRMLEKADVVLLNKMDNQLVQLGLNREALDASPKTKGAILLQLKSHQGERYAERSNWNGYDPALQGKTGLMTRFGPEGCPNFHGVASCVDYLTGYMAAWGGLAALYKREASGDKEQGDWAVTSLATCASLTQLTLQRSEPPPTAVGCHATGMTPHARVFPVAGGKKYVYGQAPPEACPDPDALAATLAGLDQDAAVAFFAKEFGDGAFAVPVRTVREMADLSADGASKTAHFAKKDSGMGWEVETW